MEETGAHRRGCDRRLGLKKPDPGFGDGCERKGLVGCDSPGRPLIPGVRSANKRVIDWLYAPEKQRLHPVTRARPGGDELLLQGADQPDPQ